MDEILTRFWNNLAGRWSGPFAFRFFLQPAMAAFYAYRDGRKDAQSARTPFLLALFGGSADGHALLREAWQAIGRVAALGVIIDGLYQIIVLGWIYPGEMIAMVLVLAIFPYLALRGLFNRLFRTAPKIR